MIITLEKNDQAVKYVAESNNTLQSYKRDIKQYENNPRNNDDAVKYVAESIKEFGFKVSIVIDKEGVIVAGHTRWKAAKSLNTKEVPCIVADDLRDQQIKAYRLADNKVSEFAGWDFNILNLELDETFEVEGRKSHASKWFWYCQ